ncbi:hypothetical protein LFYK43_21710 [Ligilactobacillus salitolerans]|uniref:Flagella synthesis protein FlgN n=1 Tax=Ligilactobacillus salitolerans TaxID=1808352 RepID=A0A401IW20_9LACO|nr:hypothetical protein [Ligilactobacillus salitolerans]GBG95712.1 hypothetical protein LFYK43_21710 [Ligilactobacillus salitolerans]
MEQTEMIEILAELKQNTFGWDQDLNSLPRLLQKNNSLLKRMQASGQQLRLNTQQQTDLQATITKYQELILLVKNEKQDVLVQLRQLDQQRQKKGGPYQQQMADGTVIELDY